MTQTLQSPDGTSFRIAKLSDVLIAPDRQRKEIDPARVMELSESIEKNQLFHCPAFREECGNLYLVAGETRMRAVQTIWELGGQYSYNSTPIPEGYIPFVLLGELDELAREEAELEENIRRTNLSWQDEADAHKRLHDLRTKQKAKTGIKHTVADTAEEIHGRRDGYYQDSVRKEIIVAKHLDNPEVAKAKSVDEAYKLLVKHEERMKNIELAKVVGASFTADKHRLFNEKCTDWMKNAILNPSERFDVILTDPPYGIGADTFGDAGGKLSGIQHHYDDSPEAWRALMGPWSELSYALAKEQAHAYVFCDLDMFHELKGFMEKAGWYVFRTPIISHKINSGRVPLPDRGPRRCYEILLYAIKGDKPVTHIYPDVISTNADEQLGHGAQKPVALYQNLLQRSVRPGDRVLDTFAGTGTIFPAAHTLHCDATGIELDAGSYAIGLKRLGQLKALENPALV